MLASMRICLSGFLYFFALTDLYLAFVVDTYPYYPLVNATTLSMAGAYLFGRKRDFHSDSLALVSAIRPSMVIEGGVPESIKDGCVIVVNHYWRPGFMSMWIGLSISATVPYPIQWTMTSAWRYPDRFRSMTITPLSRWFLKKIADSYGFILMPPMPPHPREVTARVGAVRSLMRYAQSNPSPIIAIAPEGADSGQGCLSTPPEGIGRLLYLFLERGMSLLACGLFEEEGRLHLHYGEPIQPTIDGLSRQERESVLVSLTMRAIAACLPERLRGSFA